MQYGGSNMRKTMLLFVLGIVSMLLASACSSQSGNVVGGGSNVPSSGGTDLQVKEFKMTAKQFEFDPSTIEVNKGDKVRLIVTSTDVPHGIAIPEYGINQRLDVGKPATIEFTAEKSGSFAAFCSVACGAGHRDMKGKIIVH